MDECETLGSPAILRRALAAFYGDPDTTGHPSPDASRHVQLAGHEYVVLRDADDLLAVYRLRNDGKLKRLRRWPSGLNGR